MMVQATSHEVETTMNTTASQTAVEGELARFAIQSDLHGLMDSGGESAVKEYLFSVLD